MSQELRFAHLLPELSDRSRLAVLGRLGFAHVPLYRHLDSLFSRPFGEPGCLLADPTFEAVFGWQESDKTMDELAASGRLAQRLVQAMDEPPDRDDERCPEPDPKKRRAQHPYRFGRERKPYRHQLDAWDILGRETPQSLIVASGTGSGKTECFMVPILDRLARQQAECDGRLIGVRALFLYPLNALINSQRERLRAWTDFAQGDIRFCLYNGNTPEDAKPEEKKRSPCEVLDRKTLRETPPPILVTNATMLEYMLVRSADAPILEQSQGKLEWVVLDEAHTYIGSQAAELALLIRRVLHAFGVSPDQVRFVATSATLGDPQGEDGQKLKRFLADVAGAREDRVHLVAGQRHIPPLPTTSAAGPGEFAALTADPTARRIRQHFVDKPGVAKVARLSEICPLIHSEGPFSRDQQIEALGWLDRLSDARDGNGLPFLPLRAHLFQQTLSGIWACADRACGFRQGTALDDLLWPFGQLFFEPRQHCPCGSPVYELVACDDCGEPHLLAASRGGCLMQPKPPGLVDEFELDMDTMDTPEEEEPEDEEDDGASTETKVLVVNRPGLVSTGSEIIERQSRHFVDREVQGETLSLVLQSDGGEGLFCPCCDGKGGRGRKLLQEARIGAPFSLSVILPTLLEFAPDEACKPAELPYRGRRLLTFNDSRQGTARMAARLQQESERSRVRGLVYHLALREGMQKLGADADRLQRDIEDDQLTFEEPGLSPEGRARVQRRLKANKTRLAELTKPTPIPFDELARLLSESGQDFEWMWAHYRDDISRAAFGGVSGRLGLARLFLVREFGRRPKRLNNLESMGLVAVHYPGLDRVTLAHPPFTLEEWCAFLKIALDFFVRAGGSLALDETTRHWLGLKFPRTWLVTREAGQGERRWPSATYSLKKGQRQPNIKSTLVRLLAYVLKADIATPKGGDLVDTALGAAWKALTDTSGILQAEAGGRRSLPLSALAFAPITTAWICPVTRRVLDASLCGVTPYLPIKDASEAKSKCQPITIPLYSQPFGGDAEPMAHITQARRWLEEQDVIEELRTQGVWSQLNDRVIELAPYFTAAEHSAQQPSAHLQRYETKFKNGELNLLSCSTTMEMGIDIGGISLVAMNNVPPHPANYLQRAGRAGRRQEARSLAFTLCKSNPHDQIVFAKTDWPFVTPLPAPVVALNSAVIVQRHINALVLAHFLKIAGVGSGQDTARLSSGWFFTTSDSCTPAQHLIDDCRGESIAPTLADGLRHLIEGTLYAGQDAVRLRWRVAERLEEVKQRWGGEWEALCRQEQETQALGNNPAHTAAKIQKSRMEGEYLLRELADRGFLPAYGFPTHIAAFDNLTKQQAQQIKLAQDENKKEREDNRYRRRELANRDSVTALREYAPGAEVVMDGLVYRSAGITLNWKVPATEAEAKEVQAIKFAWRCGNCGASGSSRTWEEAQHCAECGAEIKEGNIRQFIEPAGFAVDYYEDPHNDVSTQDFIPVEPPWISGDGEWRLLPNPALGRFRVTTRGHIFHQSNGLHEKGYAICLECGRTAPMNTDGSKPKIFEVAHKKLRGSKPRRRQGEWHEPDCPASQNDWAVKSNITLGAEGYTDVLEIQLANSASIWLDDKTTALSLAVALRDALAALLGVRADELGCDTKEARQEGEGKRRSILIFDRFAAGYASSAERFIEPLFREAHKRLLCRSEFELGCDSACPHCILDFDQRFFAESLDRHKALGLLTPAWLDALKLPPGLAFFGDASRPEYADIGAALLREARSPGLLSIRLYGAGSDADLGISPMRHLAYRLAGQEYRVGIVMDREGLDRLSEEDKHLLASLADHPKIQVFSTASLPKSGKGWVLAEVLIDSEAIRWGHSQETVSIADDNWGKQQPLVFASGLVPLTLLTESLTSSQLRPQPLDQGDRELVIHHELDGELQGFGKRFWAFVAEHHPATGAIIADTKIEVSSIDYHDRYLFTPLSIALLINLIEGLREILGRGRWDNPTIKVTTTSEPTIGERGPARYVWSDWPDLAMRDAAISTGFDFLGMNASVIPLPKRDTQHGRMLKVLLSNGTNISIRFDQGISYWRSARHGSPGKLTVSFDFEADEANQAQHVATVTGRVEGGFQPTQLFVQIVR